MKTEVIELIAALKRELKAQGFTYRDLAKTLKLSEASVKRLFASQRFTVERLTGICNFLGFTLAEMTRQAAASMPEVSLLSESQERELVSDEKLLLVTVCALNCWSFDEIVRSYRVNRLDVQRRLIILDRMGLIELLPGNRIRRRVRRDFDWLADGPIRRYFDDQGLHDFIRGPFAQGGESIDFAHGMLTAAAQAELNVEMRRLRARLAALHEESEAAKFEDKHGVGLLLALREWEPAGFRRLRRILPAS